MTSPDSGSSAQVARVFLRPLGNPLPLGLVGLAVATLTLAGLQLHWVPAVQGHDVGLVLVAFAAPVQLITSVLGFLSRDAPAGAAMGAQGATWLVTGLVLLTSPPGSLSPALGLLLFVAAAGVALSAVTAGMGKIVLGLVFGVTALRFVLSGVQEFTGLPGWPAAAGWCGVALCVLALYAALALDLEDTRHRPVLPVLRRARGRRAVTEGMDGADGDVQREAGVRELL